MNTLIDQLRLWQLASIALQVCVVVIEYQLVDIDLADSRRDASLCDLVGKSVGTVQDDPYTPSCLLSNGLQSVTCSQQLK